jgi:putative inorganic carbon (hco3(-)) transporter
MASALQVTAFRHMKQPSKLIIWILVTSFLLYATVSYGPWTGVLNPQHRWVSLALIAVFVSVWLIIRWRLKWTWHQTPLDRVFILWIAVFILSTVANPAHLRRILVGLWYIVTIVGIWYVLLDMLANGGLTRWRLAVSLLISGLPSLFVGVIHLLLWFSIWQPFLLAGYRSVPFARVIGTLENPNLFAAFLNILIAVSLGLCFMSRRRLWKILLGVYAAIALFLLVPTLSRGGWLGGIATLGSFGVLMVIYRPALIAPFQRWWTNRTSTAKAAFVGLGVIVALGAVIILAVPFVRFLAAPGRGDNRFLLYLSSFQQFLEKPLTGSGLFTVGERLTLFLSAPPTEVVPHSHNLILSIAAEFGIPGLIALFATVAVIFRTYQRNWREINQRERLILVSVGAALVGVAVHHQVDYPMIEIVISVIVWVALALAIAPVNSVTVGQWRQRLQTPAVFVFWLVVLTTGIWSNSAYASYVETMAYASTSKDYVGAAERLQNPINADPTMPVYYLYQGYFYGLAASQGDLDSVEKALAAYDHFIKLEPYYAPVWINQGALYWQVGEKQKAVESLKTALTIAPKSWLIAFNLGSYYEQIGDIETARAAYQQALQILPDAILYPAWQETPLRREFTPLNTTSVSTVTQVVGFLMSDQAQQARELWQQVPFDVQLQPPNLLVGLAVQLANGDRAAVQAQLKLILESKTRLYNSPWVVNVGIPLGTAMMAQFDGNSAVVQAEKENVQHYLSELPFPDDRVGQFPQTQFLRMGLIEYVLPQVYWPTTDPITLHFLNHLESG